MSQIIIKSESDQDFKSIYQIHFEAFRQENEAKLINDLRKTSKFDSRLSLVAFVNDESVGHILFYPLTLKTYNDSIPTLGLVPLAVKPEFQKKGVGTKLVNEGLSIAEKLGFKSVFVAGDPNYYGRFGFKLVNDIDNNIGEPIDHLMFLELEESTLNNISGTLIYPKEFKDL